VLRSPAGRGHEDQRPRPARQAAAGSARHSAGHGWAHGPGVRRGGPQGGGHKSVRRSARPAKPFQVDAGAADFNCPVCRYKRRGKPRPRQRAVREGRNSLETRTRRPAWLRPPNKTARLPLVGPLRDRGARGAGTGQSSAIQGQAGRNAPADARGGGIFRAGAHTQRGYEDGRALSRRASWRPAGGRRADSRSATIAPFSRRSISRRPPLTQTSRGAARRQNPVGRPAPGTAAPDRTMTDKPLLLRPADGTWTFARTFAQPRGWEMDEVQGGPRAKAGRSARRNFRRRCRQGGQERGRGTKKPLNGRNARFAQSAATVTPDVGHGTFFERPRRRAGCCRLTRHARRGASSIGLRCTRVLERGLRADEPEPGRAVGVKHGAPHLAARGKVGASGRLRHTRRAGTEGRRSRGDDEARRHTTLHAFSLDRGNSAAVAGRRARRVADAQGSAAGRRPRGPLGARESPFSPAEDNLQRLTGRERSPVPARILQGTAAGTGTTKANVATRRLAGRRRQFAVGPHQTWRVRDWAASTENSRVGARTKKPWGGRLGRVDRRQGQAAAQATGRLGAAGGLVTAGPSAAENRRLDPPGPAALLFAAT